MDATVIDTLRFADQLKAAGFQAPQAEGMARALGDQLADRMVTRNDLKETDRTIAAGFEALEPRFEAIDAKFEALEPKFDAMDAKLEAMDAKFETKFDALDVKIEPRTAKDLFTLPVLFKRKLDARHTMMALGEAIAHCHLLMHRNRLQRDLGEDGRYHFRSIDPDLERRAHPGRHDAPDDQPIMV